jgi:DNA replication protein DnaC
MNILADLITPETFNERVKGVGHEHYCYGLDFVNIRMGCKARYADAVPGSMDKQIKEWFKKTGGKGSLYVHGSVGTGKTYSICALAKLLFVNKMKVRVRNIVEYLNEMKKTFNSTDSEDSIKSMLSTEKTLILDDFGAEKPTEWTQEIIYRLVNIRYERVLHTIFISNLSLSELSKLYGDRVASRITEMVGGKSGIIKITGKDRRL